MDLMLNLCFSCEINFRKKLTISLIKLKITIAYDNFILIRFKNMPDIFFRLVNDVMKMLFSIEIVPSVLLSTVVQGQLKSFF